MTASDAFEAATGSVNQDSTNSLVVLATDSCGRADSAESLDAVTIKFVSVLGLGGLGFTGRPGFVFSAFSSEQNSRRLSR